MLTKALKGIKGCGCFGKHAKSEIEFTWGKIGWSKRGIVSKTQTNAQTDVLRSANEQTLINYIQTMAASAPEQSTHFKSTGLLA